MFDDTLKSVLALGEKTTLDGALHREGCRARKLSDAARRTSCGSGYAQDCQRRSKAATLTSTLAARQRVSGWKEGMAGGGWGGSDADTNRCIPRDSRGMSSTTSACAGAAANVGCKPCEVRIVYIIAPNGKRHFLFELAACWGQNKPFQ